MKNGLGRKIMHKFIGLKAKTCSYLIDDGSEDKKGKSHQKVCHKRNLIWKLQKQFRSKSTWE